MVHIMFVFCINFKSQCCQCCNWEVDLNIETCEKGIELRYALLHASCVHYLHTVFFVHFS